MAKSNNWQYLHPGDIIDVVAPSSWGSREDMKAGIQFLESLGLIVRVPKKLITPDFVYANEAKVVLKSLKKAFYNSDSKAIWCLRGGSGTFRLIPEMQSWKKPKKTKLFVGISDITLLHLFLNEKWDWPTLHAPMINMLAPRRSSKKERDDLKKVIFGQSNVNVFNKLIPMNNSAKKPKSIKAKMVGGNLCLVESTLGTKYSVNFKDKFVFLEDIDERGYALERSLAHLENANSFNKVKGVIFGDFVGGAERDGRDYTLKALKRFAERSPFPVLRGVESGHGSLVRSLPLNTMCELFTGSRGTLVCQTGGR